MPMHKDDWKVIKRGLEACNIPYDETKVFEGNFWYGGGQRIATQMIRRGLLPQALMCANQAMAIGAYRTFIENGIRIPEDIAITGFDALDDGVAENYRITSMIRDGECTGRRAAQALRSKLEGHPPMDIPEETSSFLIWDSCGCTEDKFTKLPGYTQDMMRPVNAGRYENFFSNYNYMAEELLHCQKLEDIPRCIHTTFRYLDGFSIIAFCLDKNWISKKAETSTSVPPIVLWSATRDSMQEFFQIPRLLFKFSTLHPHSERCNNSERTRK